MVNTVSDDELDALIEEAIVDARDEYEQRAGFFCCLQDELSTPFDAKIIGETVNIIKLEQGEDERILAVCRRNGREYRLNLLDVEIDDKNIIGSQWLAAYRKWSNHV